MAKYRKVLDQSQHITSSYRRFGTKYKCVATYEQTKKDTHIFTINKLWSEMQSILHYCKVEFYKLEVFVKYYTPWFTFFDLRNNLFYFLRRIKLKYVSFLNNSSEALINCMQA